VGCTLSTVDGRGAAAAPQALTEVQPDESASAAEIEALAAIAPAAGAEARALSPERAVLFVQQLSEHAIATMVDRSLAAEQRRRTLRLLLTAGFDLDAISRIVLGRYWRLATPAQRAEYRRLFEELVVAIYSHRFSRYSGETLSVTGAYLGKRNIVVVNSLLRGPRNGAQALVIDWLVRNTEAGPRVVDVIVGGVSMAITQRSEFASIIRNNGGDVEGLLAELRAKTG